MKVVFLDDVAGVAQGGDVKEVKNGFARNYLIPKGMAVPASREALQRIERLKRQAEAKRLTTLSDMKALGEELKGHQVNVEMRAGASGRLYGSVTNVIVAAELSRITEREIDRRTVEIDEPFRQVGTYDVRVQLHPGVDADIKLLVYPAGSDPVEFMSSLQAEATKDEEGEGATAGDEGVAEKAPHEAVEDVGTESPDQESQKH